MLMEQYHANIPVSAASMHGLASRPQSLRSLQLAENHSHFLAMGSMHWHSAAGGQRTVGLGVALQQVACDRVDLHGQLARGRDHQRPRPVARHELGAVHQLYARHQESQRLAGPCSTPQRLSQSIPIDRKPDAPPSQLCSRMDKQEAGHKSSAVR